MKKYDINPTEMCLYSSGRKMPRYLIGISFGTIFKKMFVHYNYSHRYVFLKLRYVRVRDEKIQYRSERDV